MLKHIARPNHPFMDDEKAETLATVVAEIVEKEGYCTPRLVWEHAKRDDSPLRNGFGFVYDPNRALELVNLSVARRNLNSVGTYVRGPDGETLLVPFWRGLRSTRTEDEEEDGIESTDSRFRERPLVQINEVRKDRDMGVEHVRSIAQSFAARRNELAYVSDRFAFLPSFLEALDSFLASVESMSEVEREAAG